MKVSPITQYQGIGTFGALNAQKTSKNVVKRLYNNSIFNIKNLKATNKYEPKPNTLKGKMYKAIDDYLSGFYEEIKTIIGG